MNVVRGLALFASFSMLVVCVAGYLFFLMLGFAS